jgi:hypothetical protein
MSLIYIRSCGMIIERKLLQTQHGRIFARDTKKLVRGNIYLRRMLMHGCYLGLIPCEDTSADSWRLGHRASKATHPQP